MSVGSGKPKWYEDLNLLFLGRYVEAQNVLEIYPNSSTRSFWKYTYSNIFTSDLILKTIKKGHYTYKDSQLWTLNKFLQNDHLCSFKSVYPGERHLTQEKTYCFILNHSNPQIAEEKALQKETGPHERNPLTVEMTIWESSAGPQSSCFLSVTIQAFYCGLSARTLSWGIGAFLQCWPPASGENYMMLKRFFNSP